MPQGERTTVCKRSLYNTGEDTVSYTGVLYNLTMGEATWISTENEKRARNRSTATCLIAHSLKANSASSLNSSAGNSSNKRRFCNEASLKKAGRKVCNECSGPFINIFPRNFSPLNQTTFTLSVQAVDIA